jgi:hypothetical protein
MPVSRNIPPVLLTVMLLVGVTACAQEPAPAEAAREQSSTPLALPPDPAPSLIGSPSPTPSPSAAEGPDDPLSPAPALESAAPVGQPTCRPRDLTLTDADATRHGGARQEIFVLRTVGRPCQLEGYPDVTLLDPDGATLPVTIGRGGFGVDERAASPVTLSRDTSLSFHVGTSPDGTCHDVARVRVVLPGTSAALSAATTLTACGDAAGVSVVLRAEDDETATG